MTPTSLLLGTASAALALALAAPAAHAAAGDLDVPFADRAAAALDLPDQTGIEAAVVRPDGRIVAVTERLSSLAHPTRDILVHQLLPDGSRDLGFSGDGVAEIDTGGHDDAAAVTLQSDGRILVAGSAGEPSSRNVTIFRLLADGGADRTNGALDPTFNVDGAAGADSGSDEVAAVIAVDRDDRPIVVGTTEDWTDDNESDIVVYRFLPAGGTDTQNGGLDPSFDRDGAARLTAGHHDRGRAVAVRSDGRIVVAGTAARDGGTDAVVGLLKADGGSGPVNDCLDTQFDSGGIARLRFGQGGVANALALMPDGRVLVAGAGSPTAGTPADGVVWRLRAGGGNGTVNGLLDTTFDDDGVVHLTPGEHDQPRGIGIDRARRIVVGSEGVTTGTDAVAVRLLPDGAPDPAFDGDGVAVADRAAVEDVDAFALAPDGSPVLGGASIRAAGQRPMLYRFAPVTVPPDPSAPPAAVPPTVSEPAAVPGASPRATGPSLARFGARTRVTARAGVRRGRLRVQLVNANAFPVRVALTRRGTRLSAVTLRASATRTLTLRGRRAGLRVTATDPSGGVRRVTLAPARPRRP